MDSQPTRRRGSYRYVPRSRKTEDDDKHKHHHHHHSNDNNDNSGHNHHNHNVKLDNSTISDHVVDTSINEQKSTDNTSNHDHTGHHGHDHMNLNNGQGHTSHNPSNGHIDHELVVNHTMHNAMNEHIDHHLHNATFSVADDQLPGAWNSTLPVLHNDHHHGHDGVHNCLIQDHGHSEDHSGHMGGHSGHMDGHMDGHGHMSMEGMAMDGHGHHHGMLMYFNLKTDSYFLFEGLKISSVEGILAAMLFTIFLTLVIEYIADTIRYRERRRKTMKFSTLQRFTYQVATSILHLTNVGAAYIAMLCVMSMNIWLLVSVILGSGIGHLLVRPMFESCCTKPEIVQPQSRDQPSAKLLLNTEKESCGSVNNKPSCHEVSETHTLMT